MLNRRSSSTSSPELDRDLSDFDSEEMEEMGFSKLFTYDKDRKRNATLDNNMDALVGNSLTSKNDESGIERRDKYFTFLDHVRKSEYFRSLKSKFLMNERLLPGEYMYFALTTDNVSLLDPSALRAMGDYFEVKQLNPGIEVLIALREWDNAKDPKNKIACNKNLRNALQERARATTGTFLNLHGADLSGAEFRMANLDHVDLGGANFSRANLFNTSFIYSNLDGADLSYSTCISANKKDIRGFHIKSSLARNACLDAINVPNIDWVMSDFTGASFKGAVIGSGSFESSKFNGADFHGSTLHFGDNHRGTCSLKEANLIECKLVRPDYSKLELTGAKLFADATFTSIKRLLDQLDNMDADVLEKIKDGKSSSALKTQQITAFQNIVARNIIYHLAKSDFSPDRKVDLYNVAIKHDLFQPNSFFARLANNADRSI